MNTNELCVPAAALQSDDEAGGNLTPDVGDTVDVTISGRVTRSEGGNLYIAPESANGQPLDHQEMGGETEDDDGLHRDMAKYSGGLLLLLLLLLPWIASGAQNTVWSEARACSGGAVSNWVGRAAAAQVYSIEINNFSGSTLYLLIFDSATNQLANASPHFTAVPVPTGTVGGKTWGDAGAPFYYGVNVCLSTTPFSLTNASAGGTATVIYSNKR